jgi:hypothetical protein
VIVTQDEATEILKGELDEYHLSKGRVPKVGALEPVQTRVGRRAACYVRVLDRWPHVGGGTMIRFEVARRTAAARLMSRSGWTADPDRALRDQATEYDDPASFRDGWESAGTPGEPEAVDEETEQRFADEARMHGRQAMVARRLDYEAVPLVDRVRSLIGEAERLGLDPSRDIARLEAGAAQLERRIRRAKQERR